MSHRGIKAMHQGQWEKGERQDGFLAGLNNQPATVANQHYQRGYRQGQAARKRVRIVKETVWLGNGFGSRTQHSAFFDGKLIGVFERGGLSNWAFGKRGIPCMAYKDWKRALEAGA